jgi:hypothetical protein
MFAVCGFENEDNEVLTTLFYYLGDYEISAFDYNRY